MLGGYLEGAGKDEHLHLMSIDTNPSSFGSSVILRPSVLL